MKLPTFLFLLLTNWGTSIYAIGLHLPNSAFFFFFFHCMSTWAVQGWKRKTKSCSYFCHNHFMNGLFVYSSQACYGKYIWLMTSSVQKIFFLDWVYYLSFTFYFQSSFGTAYPIEILRQCSSTTNYLILFSKNFQRQSSNSWSDWSF